MHAVATWKQSFCQGAGDCHAVMMWRDFCFKVTKTMTSNISQWLFPISALQATPSTCSLEKELYDRARGIEFLFRLGSSLALFVSCMYLLPDIAYLDSTARHLQCAHPRHGFTAFTCDFQWKIFIVRCTLVPQSIYSFWFENVIQDVAASCIFLATKTEECGRKLRDVARIYEAKILNCDITKVAVDSPVCIDVYAHLHSAEHRTGSWPASGSHPINRRSATWGPLLRFRHRESACWTRRAIWNVWEWFWGSGIRLESCTWLVKSAIYTSILGC